MFCDQIEPVVSDVLSALSPILAALIAVSAAVYVGLKQNQILEKQADIELLKLKSELFDRRMKIFQTVQRWVDVCWRNGHPPAVGSEDDRAFIEALNMTRLLFSDSVYEELHSWYLAGADILTHDTLGAYVEAGETRKTLFEKLQLVELFAPYLRIQDSGDKA